MRWRIVLLLLLLTASAGTLFSQGCTVIGPVVPTARSNGHAELMGDIIISCTGSYSGSTDLSVTLLNTSITSRALTAGATPSLEALLLMNDPDEGSQIACAASQAATSTCPPGSNVFQAVLSGPSSLVFRNVPLPATNSFFFRITNVRADVASLPGSFKTVTANVSVTPPISISGPAATTIGYASDGISVQLRTSNDSAVLPVGGLALSRYVALNQPLALSPSSSSAPDGVSFVLRMQENFGVAFKKMATATAPADVNTRPAPAPQDVPGQLYNTETGFYNPLFPTTGGLNAAGLATQATRFWVCFQSPIGVQVHAPVYQRGTGSTNSEVRLIWSNADGSGLTYSPIPATSSALGTYYDTLHPPYYLYVYEITAKGGISPYMYDTIDLPFYLAHLASSSVGLGTTSVQVGYAPISSDVAYLPRFASVSAPLTVATTTAPVLQALISSQTGTYGGVRTWQIGINNYGTAAATNARITSLSLTQTSGTACTPSITPVFPVVVGDVAVNATNTGPVTINFHGCAITALFKAVIGYTADNAASGTSTYSNKFQ